MQKIEKRTSDRNNNYGKGNPLIEINHSFGTQKRSAYQIHEHDEKGLSFLIPKSDGYFTNNTPIQFNINNNGSSKKNLNGTVKYYHPHYDKRGENFYKIGVEIQNKNRELANKNQKLRTQRYIPQNGDTPVMSFTIANNHCTYPLIDISKYSAAFYCENNNLLPFKKTTLLKDVQIVLNNEKLFNGTAIVSNIYLDKKGQNRVIIEPQKELINVDLANKNEILNPVIDETGDIINRHNSYNNIDVNFKATVSELQFFLEDFKNYLETPKAAKVAKEYPEIKQKIFERFFSTVDEKVMKIDSIVKELNLSDEETLIYRNYYRGNLLRYLMSSPYNHRIYFKPSGYAGDFEMIRMAHRADFEGETLFSQFMNKYSTSIPICESVRKRTLYFVDKIKTGVEKKGSLKVLSIASGPAIEYDILLKKHPEISDKVTVTLLDQEIEALKYSQEQLYEDRIKSGSKMELNFVHQNVGNYLRHLTRDKISENFDLIYASGLFDYFDLKTSKFVIKHLLKQTQPGGKIIIANLSEDGHDHKSYMEFGGEWYLTYRSQEDMVKLSEAIPELTEYSIKEIENGMCKFIEITV
jgi:extracellular factor (EF) 3-hydroxypalmitic acid methyl ester biosynthesis protein